MMLPLLPVGMHVLERGWLSSNNIVFTRGEESILVDSGYCTHSAQTLLLVEGILGSRPLDTLVNTHLHSDHCGGNSALQIRYPAMKTLIPPGQAEQVRDWDAVALTYLPTGQLCPKFQFNQTLQPGTLIQFGASSWEVHAAAGHDPHSVVFFEPVEKILISADALWENGFGVVFPELEGENAFTDVSATLDLIERLGPLVVVPGHGRIFIYTPDVLKLARQRLSAFVSNPCRHAHHAAKVLLKFKLLEIQQQPLEVFIQWAVSTSYLQAIHTKFFSEISTSQWITSLCEELVHTGAATMDKTHIANR
jgi:glyoxylase-like metal-dependent hydrolase (beta-lactamase superfamily II)